MFFSPRSIALVFCLATSSPTLAQDPIWSPDNGHYYTWVDVTNVAESQRTWENARVSSASMSFRGVSGHLATITSQSEQDFLNANFNFGILQTLWIGASDRGVEGEWRWMVGPEAGELFWLGESNGEEVTYAAWSGSEPNNVPHEPEGEDFAVFNWSGGRWNDLPTTRENYLIHGHIVEFSVPEPSGIAIAALGTASLMLLGWQTTFKKRRRTRGTILAIAVGLILPLNSSLANDAVTIEVPAVVTIWLAGQPDGTGFAGDFAPFNSPVAVDIAGFDPSLPLTFTVSDATSRDPHLDDYPLVGGDGETPGTGPNANIWTVGPQYDVSGLSTTFMALTGAFFDHDRHVPTPPSLDFSTVEQQSFAAFSPELQQTFFIGDGLRGIGAGDRQEFHIPSGADLLYLAPFDLGSTNNVGQLTVTVATVPEPNGAAIAAVTVMALLATASLQKQRHRYACNRSAGAAAFVLPHNATFAGAVTGPMWALQRLRGCGALDAVHANGTVMK